MFTSHKLPGLKWTEVRVYIVILIFPLKIENGI